MGAAIFVESVITELVILSEIQGGLGKRGRVSMKCPKKTCIFPHLQLGRLVSDASGSHHYAANCHVSKGVHQAAGCHVGEGIPRAPGCHVGEGVHLAAGWHVGECVPQAAGCMVDRRMADGHV